MQTLTKYHALVQSFPLAAARLGMFKPGRYSGFDTMLAGVSGGGIPIKISHAGSVILPVDNSNQWGNPEGVVLTPHGVVIKIDDIIELNLAVGIMTPEIQGEDAPVPGATVLERTDVVYLEFQWISDDTGFTPFVGIIQGPQGGAIPSLGNARTQVILGYVLVPKGATTFSKLTYVPAKVPSLGGANIVNNYPELGNEFARLAGQNSFSKYQRVIPKDIPLTLDAGDFIVLDGDSNTYSLDCSSITTNSNLSIQGIRPGPNKVYEDGTRLLIHFYNLHYIVLWGLSANGQVPGFTFPFGGLVTETSYLVDKMVYPDGVYEFVKMPNKTWWVTNAPAKIGTAIKNLRVEVAQIQASIPQSSAKIFIPEYGTNQPGCLANSLFTNTLVIANHRVTMRKWHGDVELTGQLYVNAGTAASPIHLLTLPNDLNPGRQIGFSAYWKRDSSFVEIPCHLNYDGKINMYLPTASLTASWLYFNLVCSLPS